MTFNCESCLRIYVRVRTWWTKAFHKLKMTAPVWFLLVPPSNLPPRSGILKMVLNSTCVILIADMAVNLLHPSYVCYSLWIITLKSLALLIGLPFHNLCCGGALQGSWAVEQTGVTSFWDRTDRLRYMMQAEVFFATSLDACFETVGKSHGVQGIYHSD